LPARPLACLDVTSLRFCSKAAGDKTSVWQV
jgi:hypothetical protein